ncbi:MAG: ADP-ribosylglycohydrolase family protein [Synergistaceae bacterium]|nr:ADP-ribosylglycohydrolase family protein [Synergistaceae bacterium]
MLGAVVGDIIGSPYEYANIKTTDFPLFSEGSRFTDDTVMTLATVRALMECIPHHGDGTEEFDFKIVMFDSLRRLARGFPNAGYGKSFRAWLTAKDPHPYMSMSSAAAVRVSPVAWAFDDLETVERFAELSALITHINPEAVKGTIATAGAVFLARTEHGKDEIKEYLTCKYGYDLSRTLEEIRPDYEFDTSCPGLLPEAFTAFLEGENFEDVVRKAVSLGGSSATITAIAGSIAEPFFGIPTLIQVEAFDKLYPYLQYLTEKWEQWRN